MISVQPILELCIAFTALILNAYFILRFSTLKSFHQNFRVLLIICTSACTLLAIFHPIVSFLPSDYFVLRPENYCVNAMVYGLYALKDILMNFAEFKYLLIAIERHIAFRRRSNYEHQSSRTAWQIIGGFQTIRLHKYATDHRFSCNTLSERFQVQEVINTTPLMRHLLVAFLLSIVGCSVLMTRWNPFIPTAHDHFINLQEFRNRT
ncbi:hypothetical protein M3Y98_00033900 [Aphelenchoides besseyi]|nr:hypothetical protein M3Y98_00033900 [Aphelenchoides besseyi]